MCVGLCTGACVGLSVCLSLCVFCVVVVGVCVSYGGVLVCCGCSAWWCGVWGVLWCV